MVRTTEFYDRMFGDCDTDSSLIPDVGGKEGKIFHRLKSDVSRIAEKYGVPDDMLCASAFGYTLSRYTGRSDAVFAISKGKEILAVRIVCSDTDIADYVKASAEAIKGSEENGERMKTLSKRYDLHPDIVFGCGTRTDGSELFFSVSGGTATIEHTSKYSDATCMRMAESFDAILKGFSDCRRLGEIIYTSDRDIELSDIPNNSQRPLKNRNILTAFSDAVSEHPDKIFVTCEDRSYTYRETDELANGIASVLREKGVEKGDKVLVFVERSEWYVIGAIGVMKAGAAYVPTDYAHPDDRVSFMVSDTSAKAAVVTDATESRFGKVCPDVPAVNVSSISKSKENRDADVKNKDLSMILYTSGTTGMPKGSQITHLALINVSEWYSDYIDMKEDTVLGLHTSYSFDVHVLSLFPPIILGGSVDIIPDGIRMDLVKLKEHFIERNIYNAFITTQFARAFVSVGDGVIQTLMIGGEKLGELEVPKGMRLFDGYGPSENLALSINSEVSEKCDKSDLGVMVYNVKAYILDAEKRRVPFGAVGEVYLSGYQMSNGYLNRPEVNAKSFMPNPFSKEKGHEVLYASGDFFRFLPNGCFGVIGRRDGQVKIRGNRVELTEVEASIREMEGVEDVTVRPFVKDDGSKELCAYIVSDTVTDSEVRSYVSERKPAFMVPSYVIKLDKIPLNVNGKVDKHALPKPDVFCDRDGTMPITNEEKIFCDVFARVLGMKECFANDDFFKMGGTSLTAAKVVAECMKENITLSYRMVFEFRTPKKLAAFIGSGTATTYDKEDPEFLSLNSLKNTSELTRKEYRKALIFGATGYLGAHIWHQLLEDGAKVHCAVRGPDAEDRLRSVAKHYFGGEADMMMKNTDVICADVLDDNLEKKLENIEFDIIYNSAAVVKYFSVGCIIEKVNSDGAVNVANIAKNRHARLIHISTMSVAGSGGETEKFDETMLNFGQDISNPYVHSKFTAERRIMDMVSDGLDAKFMRMGNLMPRMDGVFQTNYRENGNIEMFRTSMKFGYVSSSKAAEYMEFSPGEYAAKAVTILSALPKDRTVFHIYNNKAVKTSKVVRVTNTFGKNVEIVDENEYHVKFMASITGGGEELLSILPYIDSKIDDMKFAELDCRYTLEVLKKFGFEWPAIDDGYIARLLKYCE